MDTKPDTSFYSKNGDNLLYEHIINTPELLEVLLVEHERVEQEIEHEFLSIENDCCLLFCLICAEFV